MDTTGGLARAQTTLRHWRAPRNLPSRTPYGHGALLRRAVGGGSTPGEVCMVAPSSPEDCGTNCGHSPDRLPADTDLKAYLSHPCGVRITTGTNTAPAYTCTMALSTMVSTDPELKGGRSSLLSSLQPGRRRGGGVLGRDNKKKRPVLCFSCHLRHDRRKAGCCHGQECAEFQKTTCSNASDRKPTRR